MSEKEQKNEVARLKKVQLESFLTLVDLADRVLTHLRCHSLCGPGVKGLQQELLDVVDVPERVLRAFRNGEDSAWENGWFASRTGEDND